MATLVPGADPDVFTLSVVVFYRRALVTAGGGEHIVDVVNFPGGSEVTLGANTEEELLRVKTGGWLMLAAKVPSSTDAAFSWYQVVAAEEKPQGSGPYRRQVTLLGPDWPYPNVTAVPNQQAWLIDDVVAVYEKTMHRAP